MGRRPQLRGGRSGASGAFGRFEKATLASTTLSPGKKKQRIKNRLGQALVAHGFGRQIKFRTGEGTGTFRVEITLGSEVFSFLVTKHDVHRPKDYVARGGHEQIAAELELIVSSFAQS
jgi:hypothetical protein